MSCLEHFSSTLTGFRNLSSKIFDFSFMRNIFILFLFISSFTYAQEKPVVVVELFTSEGCSSCPPADRLLSSIVNEQYEDVEVIGLSFHVDYWNYIGWVDPYSDPVFSKRQRTYASKLISSVYTPQMVVNGKHRFVGSNRSDWRKAFTSEKSSELVAPEVSSVKLDGRKLTFDVSGAEDRQFINVAVVERDLTQSVNRGENRGRVLSHDNVVRAFDSKKKTEENSFQLVLPSDLDISKSSLVVYTQHQNNWEILGARKIDLSSFQ